jgi:hypothetical protein
MNFTEDKKRFSAISANFSKKMNKIAEKRMRIREIHTGFQQLVENYFGNFPPLRIEKYGYPKSLENSCGKRNSAWGNVGKKAKNQQLNRIVEYKLKRTCRRGYGNG